MSHFTVIVTGDDIEAQLAPFDENLEVEPYKDRIDGPTLDRTLAFYREHPEHRGELAEAQIEAAGSGDVEAGLAVLKAYEDGTEVGHDDEGFYRMSTYNPNSKWDWWSVGGRWSGYFLLKDSMPVMLDALSQGNGSVAPQGEVILPGGKVAEIGSYVYRSPFGGGQREGNTDSKRADTAPKGLIDLAGMRAEKGKAAGEAWDLYHTELGETPEPILWPEFVKRVEAGEIDIREAREQYHAQERVVAGRAVGERWNTMSREPGASEEVKRDPRVGWFWGLDHEDYAVDRRTYVVRAEAQAVPGYALLHEGNWIAPGKMGWFGWSSDTESDRWGYLEHVNGLLDGLDDTVQLTVCDLHI